MTLSDQGAALSTSAEAIVASCRAYREQGLWAEADSTLREGLAVHPRDFRLLSERVMLDNLASVGTLAPVRRRSNQGYPTVEIILCVYNALDDTRRCLDSILSKTTVPYSLTIVDDASTAEVRDHLNAFATGHEHVRVFSNSENLGYAKSTNRGLKEARAEWVVLLNSDTIVTTGWLEGLIECALSDETIAAVGPLSSNAANQTIEKAKNSSLTGGPEKMAELLKQLAKRRYPKVPILTGFCTLVSLSALKQIGYLDEINFPGYGVDNNMSLCLLKAGYRLSVADDVYVQRLAGTQL